MALLLKTNGEIEEFELPGYKRNKRTTEAFALFQEKVGGDVQWVTLNGNWNGRIYYTHGACNLDGLPLGLERNPNAIQGLIYSTHPIFKDEDGKEYTLRDLDDLCMNLSELTISRYDTDFYGPNHQHLVGDVVAMNDDEWAWMSKPDEEE